MLDGKSDKKLQKHLLNVSVTCYFHLNKTERAPNNMSSLKVQLLNIYYKHLQLSFFEWPDQSPITCQTRDSQSQQTTNTEFKNRP